MDPFSSSHSSASASVLTVSVSALLLVGLTIATAGPATAATGAQTNAPVTATEATNVGPSSATLSADINTENAVWVQFQYRKQGGSWYDWKSLGQKIGPGTVSAKIHDLEPATTYEYRVASYTGGQKRVSEWKTFTTDGDRPQTPTPSVTVKSVTDVGSSSATVASKITDMGNRAWLFPTVKYQKADDDSVWDGSYEYVSHTFRSPQTFDVQVSDLESGATYEVQVGYWDVDDGGFQWSEAKTFTTAG